MNEQIMELISADVTRTQQQRPTVPLTGHASKYKVHKLH